MTERDAVDLAREFREAFGGAAPGDVVAEILALREALAEAEGHLRIAGGVVSAGFVRRRPAAAAP